jgi:son of sevenless-like protein
VSDAPSWRTKIRSISSLLLCLALLLYSALSQALYDYNGADTGSLSFRKDARIEVLNQLDSGWWDGVLHPEKERGWFPSNYVRRLSDEETALVVAEQEAAEAAAGTGTVSPRSDRDDQPVSADTAIADPWGATVNGIGYDNLGEDLTSFSAGGTDIFAEIAAAAADDLAPRQARSGSGQGAERRPLRQRPSVQQTSQSQPSNSPSLGSQTQVAARAGEAPRARAASTSAESAPAPVAAGVQQQQGHGWANWLPRVTDDGQVYYYHTRTGEITRDLPADAEMSDQDFPASRRPSAAMSSVSAGSQDSLTAAFYENLRRKESIAQSIGSSASPPTDLVPISEDSEDRPTDGRSYFPNMDAADQRRDVQASRRPSKTPPPEMSTSTSQSSGAGWSAGHSAASSRASVDIQRLSIYSDDSALDSGLVSGKSSNRTFRAKGKAVSRSDSPGRRPRSSLDVLEPSPLPTLGELEIKARYAIAELIECAHPRQLIRRTDASAAFASPDEEPVLDEAEAERERDRLVDVLGLVVDEVRNLMHSTGALEAATGATNGLSSSSNTPRLVLPKPYHDELRPFTRRVTSTLSKLVLSVRATWGLMATSAKEELNVAATFAAELELEEDIALARQSRAGLLRARQETLNKLKLDNVVSAREVADEVSRFVEEVEQLCGNGVKKGALPVAKAPVAAFKTSAGALLLPGGGYGGNWRGNGFTTLPSTESFNGVNYSYPSNPLSIELASNFARDVQSLVEEVKQLSVAVEALSDSKKRASNVSQPGSPSHVPVAQLTSQASRLLSGISRLMEFIEDVDIASSVDLDLYPESVPGLLNSFSAVDDLKGKAKEGEPTEAQVQEYQSTLRKAKPLLAALETTKQTLYDAIPALLEALQSCAMESDGSEGSNSPVNTSEPPGTSPLSQFSPSVRPSDPLSSLLDILTGLPSTLESLNTAVHDLADIAQAQTSAHRDLRRASIAFRSKLSMGRPESTYTRSSIVGGSPASRPVDDEVDRRRESESSTDENFFAPGTAMSAESWRPARAAASAANNFVSNPGSVGPPAPSISSYDRDSDISDFRRPSDTSDTVPLRREESISRGSADERLADGELWFCIF